LICGLYRYRDRYRYRYRKQPSKRRCFDSDPDPDSDCDNDDGSGRFRGQILKRPCPRIADWFDHPSVWHGRQCERSVYDTRCMAQGGSRYDLARSL